MKKILFCCYGGGHVQALLPVIKKLKAENKYEIKVFALTTAQEVFRVNDITFFSYKDIEFTNTKEIHNLGKDAARTLDVSKLDIDETVAYLGSNLKELMDRHGCDKAQEIYRNEGRSCFYPLMLMEKILRKESPDFLVTTNSPRTEKAIMQVASDLKIPGLCVVDSFAIYESQWISKPDFGKHVCVLSESVRQRFMDNGRPSEDIYITGNPAFDNFLFPAPLEDVEDVRQEIGVKEGQKVIVYAPSPEGDQHIFTKKKTNPALPEEVLAKLLEIISSDESLFLIVRPHPSQNFDLDDNLENVFYDQGNDLKLMLSVSDLVVTLGSTVGLQAQLMRKKLVCCNQSVYANDTIYEDFGPVERVFSMEELETAIHEIIKKEDDLISYALDKEPAADIIVKLIHKELGDC